MKNNFFKILLLLSIFFLGSSFLAYASVSNGIDVGLTVGSCNNNGVCEAGNEDFFSCPADCTPIVVPPTEKGGSINGSSLAMDNIFNNLTVEVGYTNAIIRWKSVIPTMSNLKWGSTPDYKDGVIRNINFLLDHKVEITGLKEGTIYYFNIQAENLLGKTNSLENQLFRTLSLLDNAPPANPTNVTAISSSSGITISWDNPKDEDFDYVRVMKNTDRYYSSPFIGHLIYEGKGNYVTDADVKDGTKYYYSLFSRDRAGNFSSGSLISIIHNPGGKDIWGLDLTPYEKLEKLSDIYLVTQGSSTYDFKIGSTFYLSGDYPINIKTNYSSLMRNDDMWVMIRDKDGRAVWQYFFSRIKDKEGFINVDIPSIEKSGYYDVSVYRYTLNKAYLVNQGAFQISKNVVSEDKPSYLWYIFWIIIIIVLLLIIFLLIRVVLPRLYKKYLDIDKYK